jgi:aspartate aminotransferase-like enzyme
MMQMKQRLMTPGPSPVPEETLLDLARPVPYHRTAEFRKLLGEVSEELKYVFQTAHPVVTLTSSGTGAMEAAIASSIPAGGKVVCASAGRWGERWIHLATAFGAQVVPLTVPYGESVQPEQLAATLTQHPDTVAVCATLSETATGAGHDIAAFGKIVAKTPALLLVDAISGLGVVECRMDAWHVDICVTGSQKALMMPPGLAFVAVSDKAWKAIDANKSARAFYFDLKKYRAKLAESDTPFTSAHTLIRALKTSLLRLRAEGIENVWARHTRMAKAARAGVRALGLELFARQPTNGLTVFAVPEGIDGVALLQKLEKQHGLKLAGGQDALKGKIVRLAHMGYADVFDVLAALSGLEMVLWELGWRKFEPGASLAAAQQTLVLPAG